MAQSDTPSAEKSVMVRSDDEKHKVIKEACSVCHKNEEFDFLIMIYSTRKKNVKGSQAEAGSIDGQDQPKMEFAATAEGVDNFHKQMNCLFCHQKDENNKPMNDKFLTMDGKLSSLCTICHTSFKDFHFISGKRLKTKEILVLLQGYGMKLNDDGTINCITCHTIHSDKAFGHSVKDEFKQFIKEAVYFNPHGSSIACVSCHKEKPEPKQKVTFVDKNLEAICRKCHLEDIVDHHVTGVKSSKSTYLMDFLNFPLLEEKLYCSTCHDEVCYKKVNTRNKKFLIDGPYKSKEEFCNKCHKRDPGGENPHKQIDKKGDLIKTKCSVCHTKMIKEGDKDFALVSPVIDICATCHTVFDHPDRDHLVLLKGVKKENLRKYEEEYKIKLPIGSDGVITCVTCHNPHDKTVLEGVAGLGAGEYMQLRGVSFEEACTPCHREIY